MSEEKIRERRHQGTTTSPSQLQSSSHRLATLKDWLQILSSILLPLMLGVFTVVITFQQQSVARTQRLEDLQAAREQREQDKLLADLQRAEDALRREVDLNNSALQRLTDLQIAESKQKHESHRK